jgi:hypothetical protein
MPFTSKRELIEAIQRERRALLELARSIPRSRYMQAGVWGNAWTVKDLFAHLSARQRLFLKWHADARAARRPAMPAAGYNWHQTPQLNRAIQRRSRRVSVDDAFREFDASSRAVLALVQRLSERALFTPGTSRGRADIA